MSRKKAELQINAFVGGLNTEQNLLHADPNTSYDEINMRINRDQSREKRTGFDYEPTHHDVAGSTISTVYFNAYQYCTSLFIWDNAGGDPDKSLLAVQSGYTLSVFDLSLSPLSSTPIYTATLSGGSTDPNILGYNRCSTWDYVVVDGTLVIATGWHDVQILTYGSGIVTRTTDYIRVRDFWGMQVTSDSGWTGSAHDLTDPDYISERPAVSGANYNNHIYNLRNQTYGPARYNDGTDAIIDPIATFKTAAGTSGFAGTGVYPSNADQVNTFLYPDSSSTTNKTIERYWASNAFKSDPGTSHAPQGYFIIDALKRSASRITQLANLNTKNAGVAGSIYASMGIGFSLNAEYTPYGPSTVAQFAGRVWYAGFEGAVEGGATSDITPRLSSYIMFSRVVKNQKDITLCYQAADPTSNIDSAIAEDDGGYIKINDAYDIVALKQVGNYLFVFAKNGVWRVGGTYSTPFTATSYEVDKISNHGCLSPKSIVVADMNQYEHYANAGELFSVFYWSDNTIQVLTPAGYGGWQSQNISTDTINTFYNGISVDDKKACYGYFEPVYRRVHWVYNSNLTTKSGNDELIYNIDFKSFTPLNVAYSSGVYPKITAGVFNKLTEQPVYLTLKDVAGTTTFSFGNYTTSDLYDWHSTGTDVSYDAYIVTAITTGGDPRSRKEVPYLYLFFKQNGTNSACYLTTQWAWTTSVDSKKWSVKREAYKYNSIYDANSLTVYSKNKIRGSGKSFAFKIEAEAGKTLRVYGWSFSLTASNEE